MRLSSFSLLRGLPLSSRLNLQGGGNGPALAPAAGAAAFRG